MVTIIMLFQFDLLWEYHHRVATVTTHEHVNAFLLLLHPQIVELSVSD